MSRSSIEWTDDVWNAVRGCSMAKGSELKGCLNCYACGMAARNLPEMRSPTTGKAFARRTANGPRWTGAVELIPSKLDEPLRWRKPRRVFVNSMSDLFHEGLTNEQVAAVFGVMAAAPQHTFQVLTKRPSRMLEWFSWLDADRPDSNGEPVSWYPFGTILGEYGIGVNEPLRRAVASHPRHSNRERDLRWPLPNVWLGVSVEDQVTADERIPLLLQTPAAVRWVSYEPALGPVDFQAFIDPAAVPCGEDGEDVLDWIVVGGESGPGARPFDLAWARSTVEQCRAAGVPVFCKQLGARPVEHNPAAIAAGTSPRPIPLKDRKGGDPDEWPEDLRMREFPA